MLLSGAVPLNDKDEWFEKMFEKLVKLYGSLTKKLLAGASNLRV